MFVTSLLFKFIFIVVIIFGRHSMFVIRCYFTAVICCSGHRRRSGRRVANCGQSLPAASIHAASNPGRPGTKTDEAARTPICLVDCTVCQLLVSFSTSARHWCWTDEEETRLSAPHCRVSHGGHLSWNVWPSYTLFLPYLYFFRYYMFQFHCILKFMFAICHTILFRTSIYEGWPGIGTTKLDSGVQKHLRRSHIERYGPHPRARSQLARVFWSTE